MNNIKHVIGDFVCLKESKHPLSGKPVSKRKRMDALYNIATNSNYGEKYTKKEKLLAIELMKSIIEEE